MTRLHLLILPVLLFISCESLEDKPAVSEPYTGPLQEAENLDLYYSESATVKVKLEAKKLWEYANGDMEFPEGLYMEFYDETGKKTSTLKANEAYYFKEEDKYRGRGEVVIKSIENNQELKTEELFWKPDKEQMYTDEFVTITLPDQILYGHGLVAKQDFSSYEITKPEGVFYLEDE
ncbi:LPS export ABC transporter periplasmic protein LptC [Fulvivirga kasyanovii]|uniref:LPS export ABC transporter periplasmic protein LptC n=1 Tax=Fulvivirga kasyanovii TaxID=396812 RepID=A0ABW9RNU7_9BACT|nr:LPS export ABC transporter periplasmic protein LptC [Fulvivirga kasyanovii]MTI25008.1 LPS export ABC transporter periplasmic protein LptC [Fulvivirga kasyanovii]